MGPEFYIICFILIGFGVFGVLLELYFQFLKKYEEDPNKRVALDIAQMATPAILFACAYVLLSIMFKGVVFRF